MGTLSSKFKKHLQNGDEFAAMQLYQSSSDLRKNLDPNLSYGDSHSYNTPLHYAAAHAMKPLLRAFLLDRNGNPNKKNSFNQTSLHVSCQNANPKSPTSHERRKACVALILQWRGTSFVKENDNKDEETYETIDIAAVDERKNTALHYAASSGLKRCVELLVAKGAPLFAENEDKDTPCDVAEKNGHEDIMTFLESKIVFNPPVTPSDLVNEDEGFTEPYHGLTSQELQEAKDMLLVETSDMLHIPLFTAEALLRNHEWSREILLEMWMKDPLLCCERAHIQPPTSALQFRSTSPTSDINKKKCKVLPAVITTAIVAQEYQLCQSLNSPVRTTTSEEEIICEICTSLIPSLEAPVPLVCEHQFCRCCWRCYLEVKIQEGDAHNITCPAYQCSRLVPVDVIESLVTPEMVRRYLQFDIQAFVEGNPQIKWCPFPGCGRAVRLPQIDTVDPLVMNMPNTTPPAETSHAVDCGNGHFFCWECYGDAHAPCSCERWKEWHIKVNEIKPEELKSTGQATENAANCLWLVTNSKPCPNCKSPIQKNDGCNHMKCTKCKFDFCWVCLESWKKHNTATGGYFRCNRFEAVSRAEVKSELMISEAASKNTEMQELNRFVHYYTRFKNHENSHKLEEPLLKSAMEKVKLLAATSLLYTRQERQQNSQCTTRPLRKTIICSCSQRMQHSSGDSSSLSNVIPTEKFSYSPGQGMPNPNSSDNDNSLDKDELSTCQDTKFIEEAVKELLKARCVLCGSYVYGYYLLDNGYNKTIFEFMQNELEEYTEKLSEMVARPCLRTPKYKIIATAATVKRKLLEFLTAVSKGLIPPETPPGLRKHKKRRLPGLLGIDPVEDLQVTQAMENSLKDLDPDNPWVKDAQGRHTNLFTLCDWPDYDSDEDPVTKDLVTDVCKRKNCQRSRAKNPRTDEVHEFCSIQCYKCDQNREEDESKTPFEFDYNMDLLIALEMSRLQMIEDMNKMKMAGQQVLSVPSSANVDAAEADSSSKNNEACALSHASSEETFVGSTSETAEATNKNKLSEHDCPTSSRSFKHAVQISLKDDCQVLCKKEPAVGLTRSASDGQLDSLREAMMEGFHAVTFEEPITSSSGDETDVYVSSSHNTFNVPVFLRNLDSMKEIDERNLNLNNENPKTTKELIFCSKLAEKPYEESSL